MDLKSPVSTLASVGPVFVTRLKRLGIDSIEDLLLHAPSRYVDLRNISKISELTEEDLCTVSAEVINVKNVYTRFGKKFQLATISDETGSIGCVWFNQPFLVKNIEAGEKYSFSGKVGVFGNKKTLVSPEYEKISPSGKTVHTGRLVPVYPETFGISSKWLRAKISTLLSAVTDKLDDFIPKQDLETNSLDEYRESIRKIHFPHTIDETVDGRRRLAFNELLFLHIRSLRRKKGWLKRKVSQNLSIDRTLLEGFTKSLPFILTPSQLTSIKEIYSDLQQQYPMNRLLEGDVGSGKTVVAAAACFAAFVNGFQSVVMAPTQILANQHFNTLSEIFSKFKVRITLVTSSGIVSDFGKTDIFVGTHALIHKRVSFDKVALVVIDEQHRFGVEQRTHLIQKSKIGIMTPNVLTMTATPIPRTVALTVYGDMDLSVLTQLPKGRQPITTWVVPENKRTGAYEWIKHKITSEKVQAFIVCPLIEESEAETMKQIKAATKVFADLKNIFTDHSLGLLHGKLKANEKNKTLEDFREGKTDILVTTPVVEVGIDVPNATIMIIEAGEMYGLAQLHQLRGRIGRGTKKSYCMVFTRGTNGNITKRLEALTKHMSGFELSELDLSMRGPGELFGTKQHGFPELKIASWSDTELIGQSKKLAEKIIKHPHKYKKVLTKLTSVGNQQLN